MLLTLMVLLHQVLLDGSQCIEVLFLLVERQVVPVVGYLEVVTEHIGGQLIHLVEEEVPLRVLAGATALASCHTVVVVHELNVDGFLDDE